MAGFYYVKVADDDQKTMIEGKDGFVVNAENATEAKKVIKASRLFPSDAAVEAASATLLADPADLADWRAKISIYKPDASLLEQVTVTGVSTATADSFGALLVTALNATSSIAGAAYNDSTNVLTIAETTDGIGDHTVVVEFLPPATWSDPSISFDEFYSTLVHEGNSGEALSVTLVQVTTPAVLYSVDG